MTRFKFKGSQRGRSTGPVPAAAAGGGWESSAAVSRPVWRTRVVAWLAQLAPWELIAFAVALGTLANIAAIVEALGR